MTERNEKSTEMEHILKGPPPSITNGMLECAWCTEPAVVWNLDGGGACGAHANDLAKMKAREVAR